MAPFSCVGASDGCPRKCASPELSSEDLDLPGPSAPAAPIPFAHTAGHAPNFIVHPRTHPRPDDPTYMKPPPRRLSHLEFQMAPPPYEPQQKPESPSRQRRRQRRLLIVAFACSTLLFVAFSLHALDWISHAASCGSTFLTLSILISSLLALLNLIAAFTVGVALARLWRAFDKNGRLRFFRILLVIMSTMTFIVTFFASTIMLIALHFMPEQSCLIEGKTRLMICCWVLSVSSSIFHLTSMAASVSQKFLKAQVTPTAGPVFFLEDPPNYFSQIPPPPKYAIV